VPLFEAGDPADQYFQPEWAPDGKTLYFAHVNYQKLPKDQRYPTYHLYRMAYPDGQPERVAEDGSWPRVSADGSRLAYVTTDPASGWNTLILADPDGKNAKPVVFSGGPNQGIVDAPLFLSDGKFLLFSAPAAAAYQPPSWLETLLGVEVVQAHTVPSEWWRVPLEGGTPVQITHLQASGLYACLSPDGRIVASFSGSGIFVMQTDGTALTMIYNELGGIYGTVSWIP
jgi:Tol biopolymer transport system component